MGNMILINSTFNETRVAVLEQGAVAELYIERKTLQRIVGNIYKGRVDKVVPGMQAAFVNIGLDKSGFISVEDVREDSLYEIFFESGEKAQEKPKLHKDNKNLIQDILREGQQVLVQVLKESVGGKGAKLSSYIALPGKYLVLLGNVDIVGISRKIESPEERERLGEAIRSMKPDSIGFIARTVSSGVSEDDLKQDMDELVSNWEIITNKSDNQKDPALLYEEPRLYIKAARDFGSKDISKIVVDDEDTYKEIKSYVNQNFPGLNLKIELYNDDIPLFERHGVENEIKKIFKKKVWLKSGGHIIIEEAEGLTVVDVNTGRFTSGKTQEDTIFTLNLEAASEIVRQIRLRNLVGIVVIDFIDIKNRQLRDQIYEAFVEQLKCDRARSVVLEMSAFGVIQMTRQRIRESILSELADPCSYCEGVGYVKSTGTMSYEIIREIQRHIRQPLSQKIEISANSEVINRIKSTEGDKINKLEKKFGVEVIFNSIDVRVDKYEIVIH